MGRVFGANLSHELDRQEEVEVNGDSSQVVLQVILILEGMQP